jgi:hypothetical protein
MPVFNKKDNHVLVDIFYSSRHNQDEEDHSLYFDTDALAFFVVEERDYVSGPNVSPYHTVYSLDEYVQANPALKEKIAKMIAERVAYQSQPKKK